MVEACVITSYSIHYTKLYESEIIFLRSQCGDIYTVQAGSMLEIRYGNWGAIGEELAIQNAEHLTVKLVLNGEVVTGIQQLV